MCSSGGGWREGGKWCGTVCAVCLVGVVTRTRRFGFEALLEVWILAIMVTPILGKENDNSEAVKDTQRTRGTGSRSPATHGCPSAFLVAMTFT